VDKHSNRRLWATRSSICLAPLVAACGVAVPMISGRGLGHPEARSTSWRHPRLHGPARPEEVRTHRTRRGRVDDRPKRQSPPRRPHLRPCASHRGPSNASRDRASILSKSWRGHRRPSLGRPRSPRRVHERPEICRAWPTHWFAWAAAPASASSHAHRHVRAHRALSQRLELAKRSRSWQKCRAADTRELTLTPGR